MAGRHKAVLIDIDGTLLDSNAAHTSAWVEVLRRHGHPVDDADVRPLIGKGGDKLLEALVGFDDETDAGKAMSDERKAVFKAKYLEALQPMPGARALLSRLAEADVALVVATSASSEELGDLLAQAGVDDLIETSTTSSDAESSKPDPDIIEAALQKAGLAPHEVVMLGDTPYDIEAARKAGVDTIAFRCGGWWDDAAFGGAVAIYDDPAALLADLDASPLADAVSDRAAFAATA